MSEEIVSSPVCGTVLDFFVRYSVGPNFPGIFVRYSVGPTSINVLFFGSVGSKGRTSQLGPGRIRALDALRYVWYCVSTMSDTILLILHDKGLIAIYTCLRVMIVGCVSKTWFPSTRAEPECHFRR